MLIRLLDKHHINKYSTRLKLEVANTLDIKYDQILYTGPTKTSITIRLAKSARDALRLCLIKGLPTKPNGGYAFFYKSVPTAFKSYNGPRDITPLLAAKVKSTIS